MQIEFWKRVLGQQIVAAVLLMSSVSASADFLDEAVEAIRKGEVKLNFRYRFEHVDQDSFTRDANASTLRSRISYKTANFHGWTALVEADQLSSLGPERFNSTENGRTDFPVVADPEGFDLNQALLRYKTDKVTATIGRQRINHADQRFIGGVAWRQNEQTYDGVRLQAKANARVSLDYAYVANVNRIFGPGDGAQPGDWQGDSHIFRAEFIAAEKQKFSVFAYLLDFENDNGPPNSTQTYGLTYNGGFGPVSVDATIATQSDYENSPLNYSAEFFSVAAAYSFKPIKLSVGYDVLGSDNGIAGFRTPLATLHKFQGFADLFLGTPAAGIEDFYVGLAGKAGPVKLAATWHDFQSEEGSIDYGTEINLVATWPVTKRVTLQAKFADYNADDFAVDTTRFWFSAIFNL